MFSTPGGLTSSPGVDLKRAGRDVPRATAHL